MSILPDRILIVGGVGGTCVGDSFFRAANRLGLQAEIMDSALSYQAPAWRRRISWYLLGRRPVHLERFSQQVLDAVNRFQPEVVLTTGLAPVTHEVLWLISRMDVRTINFLTDDPWNRAHRAAWFMQALPVYDEVYSPRQAMMDDLRRVGCGKVEYLPFGYDPDLFYPESPESCAQAGFTETDVVFAGGADRDRVPYMKALVDAGIDLALYGGYWQRWPETRAIARGQADVRTLRLALSSARVGLCLVRRANRDGSCMRTFEVPAVGACMLTEDTQEHRYLFGQEGEAVLYFDSMSDMLEKTRLLCTDKKLRESLAAGAHRLVVEGKHCYQDRLVNMLQGKGWSS